MKQEQSPALATDPEASESLPHGRERQAPLRFRGSAHTVMSIRHAAAVTVCVGSIAILASVYWFSALRLPNPETADRDGLLRWLVLRDLRSETPEIRSTLLKRIETELEGNFDPAEVGEQLDERYRDRLWANILALIETWYSNKVDGYQATAPSERCAFLDGTITEIETWKELAALRPGAGGTDSSAGISMLELFGQQVALFKEKASPQRQHEITEFDTSLRGRWLMRALGLPPSEVR